MPIVHVNVWEGFGEEKAKAVIQNITKVFVDMKARINKSYFELFSKIS